MSSYEILARINFQQEINGNRGQDINVWKQYKKNKGANLQVLSLEYLVGLDFWCN
jgi:hypothetical protein